MNINLTTFKDKINQKSTFNLGGVFFLVMSVYFICYILISDEVISALSICSVSTSFSHWAKHWHVLAVGLLPVYVALMIFGAALFGVCLGSALHHWIARFFTKNKNL